MAKKKELLDELLLMADLFGNGTSVETDMGVLSTRCGFTVSRTRKLLSTLERNAKIRVLHKDTKSIAGGYERIAVHLLM